MSITWSSKSVPITSLKEYKHNPRKMTKKEYEKLVRSLKEDGYHSRIKVDRNLTIIGGHRRKRALTEALGADTVIEVLIPNRDLTEEEFDRINIRDNLPYGSYDFDILSSRFELDFLVDVGMDENMMIGFDEVIEDDESSKGKDEEKRKCDCDCCKH